MHKPNRGGFGGPKGPRPSLLLNKMFDKKCKNVQNSNEIAPNSLKMLEIAFWTIQIQNFPGEHAPVPHNNSELIFK